MATAMPVPKGGQEQSKTPLQIFINAYEDSPFSDTVLVSASDESFKTYKGLLCKQSVVLRDTFENCDDAASSPLVKNGAFELSLPEASAEIAVTLAYIHDSDGFS